MSGETRRAATIVSGSDARHDREGERTAKRAEGDAHRLYEPDAAGKSADSTRWATISVSVSDSKDVARLAQLVCELPPVLDDAVVDDCDRAGAVGVRVGVLFGRVPVGRPAGVADAGVRLGRVFSTTLRSFSRERVPSAARARHMPSGMLRATPAES